MKRLFTILLIACPLALLSQKKHSSELDAALNKAGANRPELEKAIAYFKKTGDPLKQKAIEFLIANMDIHFSASYYWADSSGKRVDFNELDYPEFSMALQAFNEKKKQVRGIHPQPIFYKDINTIKGDFLIDNVERAFVAWKSPWAKSLNFDRFCEYILPYRASVEPLQNWRSVYQNKFAWINDSAKGKTQDEALVMLANDFKKWFVNTYEKEVRKEPLPRLGAMQLLLRKKGPCEDMADLAVFALRSQGFPVTNDMVTYWATASGKHFFNSTLTDSLQPIRFDVSSSTVRMTSFSREPAKVVRTTYAKQPNTLANFEDPNNIPEGFMRTVNYLDVTKEYWQIADVKCSLNNIAENPKVAFACVFNFSNWRPTWWGRVDGNSAMFTSMCKGAVYLPAYYLNGNMKPAGYPVAVTNDDRQIVLAPDTKNKRSVVIKEQDKYLMFRPGKKYKLLYWDNEWKVIAEKTASPAVAAAHELQFDNVPRNALLLFVPDYTQHKERPFSISDDGVRTWW